MSARNKIQLSIINKLQELLKEKNYIYIKNEECFRKIINDRIAWTFSFYLSDRKVYSGSSIVALEYTKFTELLRKLVDQLPVSAVGISANMIKFSTEFIYLKISSMDEVNSYAEAFCQFLEIAEKQFFIPLSDESAVVDKYKLRRVTQWPACLTQCLSYLVAYGIDHNDEDIIKLGIDKWREKSKDASYCLRDEEKEYYHALHQALIDKGYIDADTVE